MESTICTKWINSQYTDEEQRRAVLYFYEKCRIPNITGCVDGTHIRIIGPNREIRHLYYNRKGYHSVNAMIVRILIFEINNYKFIHIYTFLRFAIT